MLKLSVKITEMRHSDFLAAFALTSPPNSRDYLVWVPSGKLHVGERQIRPADNDICEGVLADAYSQQDLHMATSYEIIDLRETHLLRNPVSGAWEGEMTSIWSESDDDMRNLFAALGLRGKQENHRHAAAA